MKKLISVCLAAVLLLGVLCSGTALAEEPVSLDGSVIFEKDGVKVTTAGLDQDPTDLEPSPIIWVDIENSSEEDAYLGVANGSVNGFDASVLLITFYMEDGEYYGASYDISLTIPAGESGRYALGYYKIGIPGVDISTLAELRFCFTMAEDEYAWPNYTSAPVTITTGETVETVDISALGTVVLDNDKLTVVIGDQDYDDWFGPEVYYYVANKTDRFLGFTADTAEVDGVFCDYLYAGITVGPGLKAAGSISFDGDARELKGFEHLTLNCILAEADSKDNLFLYDGETLDPISVSFPPQIWGEYENGGMHMDIQPKYNDLLTVETPVNDENGVLFTVSETASLEAGGYEGAGWLFSIAKVSEDRLHEMLGSDMSGADVFARDDNNNYYVKYHATDVRYERATAEEMQKDAAQWTMLGEWANGYQDHLIEENGLESISFSNTEVDILLARAAWQEDVKATISTTEFGPVDAKTVDATPYVNFVMKGFFCEVEDGDAPDGEYVVLDFPDDDLRLDFFFAPGSYVRVVSGENERLYESVLWDGDISISEAMKGWYYQAAEAAGVKEKDDSLDTFSGRWAEKIAGRGVITVENTVAPGKLKFEVEWPESAAVLDSWSMVAAVDEEGRLCYENGNRIVTEFDENGDGWTIDESWDESGYFYLSGEGELCWHDNNAEGGEDSVFIHA